MQQISCREKCGAARKAVARLPVTLRIGRGPNLMTASGQILLMAVAEALRELASKGAASPLRRSRRSQLRVTPALVGNSSQVRPSSSRPARPFPTRCIRTAPSGLSDSILSHCPPSRSMRLTAPRWLSSASVHKTDSGACAPHCLKKYGTPAAWHWSRRDRAQSGCMGRARGPDSPPAITHSSPPGSHWRRSISPRSGSQLANRTPPRTSPRACPAGLAPTSASRPKPRATGSAGTGR